jgi:hypothetical protein
MHKVPHSKKMASPSEVHISAECSSEEHFIYIGPREYCKIMQISDQTLSEMEKSSENTKASGDTANDRP